MRTTAKFGSYRFENEAVVEWVESNGDGYTVAMFRIDRLPNAEKLAEDLVEKLNKVEANG